MDKHILITVDLEDFKFDLARELGQVINNDDSIIFNRFIDKLEKILLDYGQPNRLTFFVTGIFCQKYPNIVRQLSLKHEISSHLYYHDSASDLTSEEFELQIIKSKEIIKSITGSYPKGFRAPDFKIHNFKFNAFTILNKHFDYDSSLCIVYDADFVSNDQLKFLPIPILGVFNGLFSLRILGGSHLKFIPIFLISYIIKKCTSKNKIPQIYIHPYELNVNFTGIYNTLSNHRISFLMRLYWLFRQLQWHGPLNFLFILKLKYILSNYKSIGRIDEFLCKK